ncbi:MAG TPA: ABC transporter ATP-binding protein, partial [Gemmatimonadales bacterium]|nr:ABC transporter ATP-binding protein [Gemmatimonadales bacterium]
TFSAPSGVAHAVDGVDLTVRQGETVALVGESGSGKTATALAILRLVEPEGHIGHGAQIRLDGRDLLALPPREIRTVRGNHVALVFQEPGAALNPVISVGGHIVEALRAHHRISKRDAWARAVEMLRTVGVPEPEVRARHYAHQLSGGLRQRAMLAIALACHPKLLIADEPTTALDVTIQAEILALLAELRSKSGMAVLLITHNLGIVAEHAERAYVMYAGQIVEEAPVTRLFAAPVHPYTEGLLAAVPRPDEKRPRLTAIPGQIPEATDWPAGCRFHPRCPWAWERCRTDAPQLLDVSAGHRARCWLVVEPARRTGATAV